jgi:mitosis inhibitor protein kinase SWE1
MMRTDPGLRVDIGRICAHPVIARARAGMEEMLVGARAGGAGVRGAALFGASPLARVPEGFLEGILGRGDEGAMDVSP